MTAIVPSGTSMDGFFQVWPRRVITEVSGPQDLLDTILTCVRGHTLVLDGRASPHEEAMQKAMRQLITQVSVDLIAFRHFQWGEALLESTVSKLAMLARKAPNSTAVLFLNAEPAPKVLRFYPFLRIALSREGSEAKAKCIKSMLDTMQGHYIRFEPARPG